MAAISQTTFSTTFSWMRSFVFWFQFHWRFFLSVQLTKSHHWFREWLGTEQATSHYLKHCWPSSLTHICRTRGRWVKWWCIPKSMHTLRVLLFLVIFTHILQGCFTGTGAILWIELRMSSGMILTEWYMFNTFETETKCHWSLFLRVQLTIFQDWFR